ncbi:MAG: T9SS type A sorting domain-containing protein [Bacteroidales bacterium]|nr:T9SS type A sorting domain-containing protein [Bacteroidales bacterium]
MKRKILLLFAVMWTTISFGQTDLIITGVYDGPLTGGIPKGIELYVANDIADLALYAIGSANNGGGTDGPEFTLSGTATAGDFIYIASESVEFTNFFGFAPNFTSSSMAINGDDAVELFFDATGAFTGTEVVVDLFGDANVDGTGQTWEYMDGWAYRNNATGPDPIFTDTDWFYSGINALDGETTNATAATPFPLGTYLVPTNDQTSTVTAPTTQIAAGTLSSVNIDSVPVIQFVITDAASGDGLPTNVTGIFLNAGPNNTLNFNTEISGGGVYNITNAAVITLTAQPTVTTNSVYLPVALTIPDGGSVTVEGYVYLDNTNALDGNILQFQVNAASHGFTSDLSGSNFENTFAGGDIVGNNFTVSVVATQFSFLTQPSNVIVNTVMNNVVIGTTDAYGNIDVDFPSTLIEVLFSGTGIMAGTSGVSTTNGVSTYTDLTFDTEQTAVYLTANDINTTTGFADVLSSTFDISVPPAGGSTCATAAVITAGTHQAIHTVDNDYDQWYSFVATVTGTATVENCDSDVDVYVAIDKATCGSGYDLQEDACGPSGFSVNLTFNITQGETYFIGFGNWDQATTPNYSWSLTESDVTPVNSIALLRAGTAGLKYELTSEAVLTYQQSYRNQKFIEDATGAILIDDNSGIITTAYNRYDGITGITGTLSEYNGMLQFVPIADPGTATSTNNTITPQVITLAQFNSNFETYEAELIKVENITFTDAGGTFANGIVYSVSDASKANASFRTNFYDVDYIGGTIPGNINVTGLCIDKGTAGDGYTFTARDLADFEVILATDATLSDLTVDGTTVTGFSPSTLTYNVELAYGTTTVPTVVGTPTDANANAVTTDASGLPGSSTVLVTAEDGSTTETYTVNFTVASTGINELDSEILIYPNPSTGVFNIKTDGILNIEISDITGKVINSKTISGNSSIQINTQGVYFLKFSNDKGSFTQKVIVQ